MKKQNSRQPAPKPVVRKLFENPVNQEQWVCENVNETKTIDVVEFIAVHAVGNARTVLMRKDALKQLR